MPLYDLKQVDRQPTDPFEVWLEKTSDDTYTIHRWCAICKKPSEVKDCSREGVEEWSLGTGLYVQQAFPNKSADERETILSGAHGTCFDEEFTEVDDEDEYDDEVF